jgi:hypothetical protein
MDLSTLLTQRLLRGVVRRLNDRRVAGMARQVALHVPQTDRRPVAFFKASTGIDDLSWNSSFHLLSSWAVRLRGVPVAYFACSAGMSRCVLGTNRDDVKRPPPCRACIHQSGTLYTGVPPSAPPASATGAQPVAVYWFAFSRDAGLEADLRSLSLAGLAGFSRSLPGPPGVMNTIPAIPLGELCLPGLRWILRRHNLVDESDTRFLLREYILSAWNVAQEFSTFLDVTDPQAVVVFNGQFFPEAVARFVAISRGLRVITHEVGLQPASAFFTDGEATAYPIAIPDDFDLTDQQNARLDGYLEQRFQGRFSMAGIRFWPDIRGLDAAFLERAAHFTQIVPVFTNVIFDTSQPHANTVFTDMFAWLDMILDVIAHHPETLFVIRAHPDETRLRKESRETVQGWAARHDLAALPNAVFIAPGEYLSSYELVQRAKFVMVYNSTIGLEASIMGRPVLCGGKARYTQYPTVFFPQTVDRQRALMERFLEAESIDTPAEFRRNARRFLYYQVFRSSLPFGDYLRPSVRTTQARLRAFDLGQLMQAPAIRAVLNGLLGGGDFLLKE